MPKNYDVFIIFFLFLENNYVGFIYINLVGSCLHQLILEDDWSNPITIRYKKNYRNILNHSS